MDQEIRKRILAQLKLPKPLVNGENLTHASGLWGNGKNARGNAVGLTGPITRISGDVSNIWGVISNHLSGDVSGLSGCITGVRGKATGISANAFDAIEVLREAEKLARLEALEKPGRPKLTWADWLRRKKPEPPPVQPPEST
jgi:hypothetical protein